MRLNRMLRAPVLALLASAVSVSAVLASPIISVGGDLVLVPRPATLNYNGGLFSGITNPNPIIFSEYTAVPIPVFSALPPTNPVFAYVGGIGPGTFIGLDFLPVDIMAPGSYPPSAIDTSLFLVSGTIVSSFIVNFEPSDIDPVGSATGSVTFDSDVLAIQTQFATSPGYARKLLFESPGNVFSTVSLHGSTGLELGNAPPDVADQIALSADRRTVSFSFNLNGATDGFRIFVAPMAVPEPLTLSTFGLGLGALFAVRRRNVKRRA